MRLNRKEFARYSKVGKLMNPKERTVYVALTQMLENQEAGKSNKYEKLSSW